MLTSLFGNKSIERILLFLLVNERCYPSLLQKKLNIALTPIQKGLERLEKGGIVVSSRMGKVKTYQFNQHYPFFNELEALLRQVYTHLPVHEKKQYYLSDFCQNDLLLGIWNDFKVVRSVSFYARSILKKKPMGKGKGKVDVEITGKGEIIFHEEGQLENAEGKIFNYKNAFRWTYHHFEGMISLEHLRFGRDHPVFLFHLISRGQILESINPHLCGKDTYFGYMHRRKQNITLLCRIISAKKNEEIEYSYNA